jgi:hypothetical protein
MQMKYRQSTSISGSWPFQELNKEETLFKTQPNQQQGEVIGYCPGCDRPITDDQPTKLVLGQLYHAAHAPRAESRG